MEKVFNALVVTIIILFILCIIMVIFLLSDFYNDYKCSTRDNEYFKEHNCERYLK